MSTIASHAVRISADTSAAENGLKGINKRFGDATAGSKALLGGVVALAVGAVAFGVKSVQAFNVQAAAEAKLIQLHHENTGATMAQTNELMKLASEVQKYGVIGDEAIISGQAQLSTFKMSTDAIKSLTPAMADMVAQQKGVNATGDDFVNIGNLIGKVMEGNIGALGRYGVSFDETSEKILKNGTESERAAELAKVLEANYGGVNKALRETPEGKIKALKDRFGDLQEGVGKMISEGMGPLLDSFGDWFTAIEDAGGLQEYLTEKFEENEKTIWMVAGAIAIGIVPALYAMAAGVWAVMAPLIPFLAVGAALGAVAYLIYENWDKISPLFETVKTVVTEAFEKIKAVVLPIVNEVTGVVVEQFQKIKAWVDENWPLIEKIIKLVMTQIQTAIKTAMAIIGPIWDVAWSAIKGIIGIVWPIIKTVISTTLDVILGIIKTVMQLMTGDFSGAWETIKGVFADALNNIWGLIVGTKDRFLKAGGDLIKAFIKGIKDAFVGVYAAVSGGMARVRNLLPFSDAKEGPLSDLTLSGQRMMETFAKGISLGKESLARTVGASLGSFSVGLPLAPLTSAPPVAGSTRGDTIITGNTFHIREEADIEKIARRLTVLREARA